MKARPRKVEREIAKCISLFYTQHGMSPVERIPILGRTGPDITVNEMKLAIDVKSRIQVPKSMLVEPGVVRIFGVENYLMLGVALCDLDLLFKDEYNPSTRIPAQGSYMALRWLLHMKEWADADACTAALVLHKPKLEYSKSTFIIFEKDRSKLLW